MTIHRPKLDGLADSDPLPFPAEEGQDRRAAPSQAAEDALAALDSMSRKIRDLARELNCLGYFDGDDDRPRAA